MVKVFLHNVLFNVGILSLAASFAIYDDSRINWGGHVSSNELMVGGHGQISSDSSGSYAASNPTHSVGPSGSIHNYIEQLPPPDMSAPHLANSGIDEVSFLDALDPVAPAVPEVAQADPATLISMSDVQRLVAEAGNVSLSPNRGWVYVNKPVFFSTDAFAHDRQLVVLGSPVAVHLVPVGYTWSPGDGSPAILSVGPGGTWPNGDVTHSYRKAGTNIQVGLTIEWSASFTVQGSTYPIVGTATASSVSAPFEVREAEAVLR